MSIKGVALVVRNRGSLANSLVPRFEDAAAISRKMSSRKHSWIKPKIGCAEIVYKPFNGCSMTHSLVPGLEDAAAVSRERSLRRHNLIKPKIDCV